MKQQWFLLDSAKRLLLSPSRANLVFLMIQKFQKEEKEVLKRCGAMNSFQLSLQGDGGLVSAFDSSDNGQIICVGYSRCLAIYRLTNPIPGQ